MTSGTYSWIADQPHRQPLLYTSPLGEVTAQVGQSSGPLGEERAAGRLPRLRSGIQLGEARSRLPGGLVQLVRVGEEGHHQGVDHREPPQPLLLVAAERRREHQIQMLQVFERPDRPP